MNVEEEAVGRLVRRLEALGIPYMVAGAVASSHHGHPRATNDADVVIDPSPPALEALLAALPGDGYYVDAGIVREALRDRRLFNVIDRETAFRVDLMIRRERPFSREEFARRERRELEGLPVFIATAEDTILSKLEWAAKAGSPERHLADALGVLQVSGDRIDRDYVERWAVALGIEEAWRELLRQHDAGRPPGPAVTPAGAGSRPPSR